MTKKQFSNNQKIRNFLNEIYHTENLTNEQKELVKIIYAKFSRDFDINFSYEIDEYRMYREFGYFPLIKKGKSISVKKPTTKATFIKGENLYALDLMTPIMSNKFDFIYLDPPYNTKNDGLNYDDRFSRSEWSTDIYLRMIRAHKLLSDDGFIAVSIDDRELAPLISIMDSIFGRENKVAIFPRQSKTNDGGSGNVAIINDWLLLYTKEPETSLCRFDFNNESDYTLEDDFLEERGYFYAKHTLDTSSLGYQEGLDFIVEIDGKSFVPGGNMEAYLERKKGNFDEFDPRWTWNKERIDIGLKLGLIIVKGDRLYIKKYSKVQFAKGTNTLEPKENKRVISSLEFANSAYTNEIATKEIKKLLQVKTLQFKFPKPTSLIMKIMELHNSKNIKTLDFYAGTGTLAHAVNSLNIKDGGERTAFMITNEQSNIDEVIIKRMEALKTVNFETYEVLKTEEPALFEDVKKELESSFEILKEIMLKHFDEKVLKNLREVFDNEII